MDGLRNKALSFLARREHSRAELRRKLGRKVDDLDEIELTLVDLAREGLQSDARYAESYVRSRIQSGYGPVRIEKELQSNGIEPALILEHLPQESQIWEANLLRVWQKKFQGHLPSDAKAYASQCRFLLQRGFSMEMIYQLDLYRG